MKLLDNFVGKSCFARLSFNICKNSSTPRCCRVTYKARVSQTMNELHLVRISCFSLTFISLIVEPSLTLLNTLVPCLSYCRFHPSILSASRRKCSKSSAFAGRTSPTCIEQPCTQLGYPSPYLRQTC